MSSLDMEQIKMKGHIKDRETGKDVCAPFDYSLRAGIAALANFTTAVEVLRNAGPVDTLLMTTMKLAGRERGEYIDVS